MNKIIDVTFWCRVNLLKNSFHVLYIFKALNLSKDLFYCLMYVTIGNSIQAQNSKMEVPL
jgi:hypothetical protein